MKHKLRKLLFIFVLVFGFITNVNAQTTIKEDASKYDGDIYIIGSSKFDSDVIVTGTMVGVAGAREAFLHYKCYFGCDENDYMFRPEDLKIYYYSGLDKVWSLLPATSKDEFRDLTEEEVKKLTENLNIYYVNDKEKLVEVPYDIELEEGHELVFNSVQDIQYKEGKLIIPATVRSIDIYSKNKEGNSVLLDSVIQNDKVFEINSVVVKTLEELKEAIALEKAEIRLGNDITDITETITIPYKVSFRGAGYKLSFKDIEKSEDKHTASGLVIGGDKSFITDLTIEMNSKEEWQGNYALQVFNAQSVRINNYAGTKADAALLVNSSSVILDGQINLTGNEYGGIEVSKSENSGIFGALELYSKITMNDEAIDKPAMWIVNGQGSINDETNTLMAITSLPTLIGKAQTYFYTSEDVYKNAGVSSEEELNLAMLIPEVEVITLENDIELSSSLTLNKNIKLDLNKKTLTLKNPIIVSDNVQFKNGNIVRHETFTSGSMVYASGINSIIMLDNVLLDGKDTLIAKTDLNGNGISLSEGASLITKDSKINNHKAGWYGAAVYATGAGDITLENTVLDNNSVESMQGAVFYAENSGNIDFINTTVSNSVVANAYVVSVNNCNEFIFDKDSKVINNKALEIPGINIGDTNSTIAGTIANNIATDTTGEGKSGGLHTNLSNESYTVTITETAVIKDNVSAGAGGGVYVNGPTTGNPGKVIINGATITGNTAKGTPAEKTLKDGAGAGIFVGRGILEINNVIIKDNISTCGTETSCEIGTAISVSNYGSNVEGGKLIINDGIIDGTIELGKYGSPSTNAGLITINGGTFTDERVINYGVAASTIKFAEGNFDRLVVDYSRNDITSGNGSAKTPYATVRNLGNFTIAGSGIETVVNKLLINSYHLTYFDGTDSLALGNGAHVSGDSGYVFDTLTIKDMTITNPVSVSDSRVIANKIVFDNVVFDMESTPNSDSFTFINYYSEKIKEIVIKNCTFKNSTAEHVTYFLSQGTKGNNSGTNITIENNKFFGGIRGIMVAGANDGKQGGKFNIINNEFTDVTDRAIRVSSALTSTSIFTITENKFNNVNTEEGQVFKTDANKDTVVFENNTTNGIASVYSKDTGIAE